jgi:two-component system NtrC family sensor kinase
MCDAAQHCIEGTKPCLSGCRNILALVEAEPRGVCWDGHFGNATTKAKALTSPNALKGGGNCGNHKKALFAFFQHLLGHNARRSGVSNEREASVAMTARAAPRRALSQLRLLLISAYVLPVCLYLLTAFLTYRAFTADARDEIERTANAAAEHASKVFATDELVLDRIAERIAPMSWDEIATSVDVHNFLVEMKRSLPQAQAIGIIAPDRRILNTNYAFPAPLLYQLDRQVLTVPRNGAADFYISDVTHGVRTGSLLFAVSRPKPGTDTAAGAGEINIATSPQELAKYYETLAGKPGVHIALFRSDGAILARNPAPREPLNYPADGDVMRAIKSSPSTGLVSGPSSIDGRHRLLFYKAVADYPVYVAASYDRDAVIQHWLLIMGSHLIYGIPVTLALILVTRSAIRRTHREQRAIAHARNEAEKRVVAEEHLREAQRLEAVGQLTGGIAHDFNNILTVIVGNLDLLARHVTADPGKRMIGTMQRAASRGARLTQSLLAFARRQALRPEIINPNRLINEIGELLRRAVGEAVEMEFVLSPTLDPCRIDPVQFESALLNLVVNARDAIAQKAGKIVIETQNVVFDAQNRPPLMVIAFGQYIAISVVDNGAGMAPEILSRVFEPFFTTKEVGRGSGLGLSQVYGFVKQSGGYVHIESERGVGTRVRLYLPRSRDTAETGEPLTRGEPIDPDARGATILVVEDEADVREVVAAELTNFGYRVLTAGDGPEALEILKQESGIDLLFSDVVMPRGMTGDELAREAQRRWPALKILLTSGYPPTEPPERQSLGAFRVLQKPYRIEELLRLIGERLHH